MLDEITKKATIVANFQLAMSDWHNWDLLLFCVDGILTRGGTRWPVTRSCLDAYRFSALTCSLAMVLL